MADKSNKITLSLIKKDFPLDQIVKEGVAGHEIEGVGVFYSEDSHVRTPTWFSDFFGADLDPPFRLRTASSKGALIVKRSVHDDDRVFVLLFGNGRFLLNEGAVEERFGMKIVLNSMKKDSIRSIDRTALGSTPKQSREQMTRESAVSSFGIDIEQDLVRSVTARSSEPRFGKAISGRDTLTMTAKFDHEDLQDLLDLCMTQYASLAYQEDYGWIDQIKDVRDPVLLTKLNAVLIERLTAGEVAGVWMAAPEIIDWVDIKGFRYGRAKKAELHDDLDLAEFLSTLGETPVTIDELKARVVVAVSAKTDSDVEQWNAYRCLYAEVGDDAGMYILNNARWYEVAKDFATEVVAYFEQIPSTVLALPNYAHDGEEAYNITATEAVGGACCMDQKLVQHGGGHSKIEFCDVLTAEKKIIHVKRYSGSAQLSHLFAQGAVSGELFIQDAQFREKLNDKLPDAHKLADPHVRPDPSAYEIVFAIVANSDALDIPFFSKVSFRNARRRLKGYGYEVTKKHVLVTAPNPARPG